MSTDENRHTRTFAVTLGGLLMLIFAALGVLSAVGAVTGTNAVDEAGSALSRGATFATTYSTGWSAPADARLALEAQTALVERIAAAHGSAWRVVATTTQVRTRNERGGRLARPVARFERIFELQLPRDRDQLALRRALDSVQVAARGSVGATHLPRVTATTDSLSSAVDR
jgi:hypothetical protein